MLHHTSAQDNHASLACKGGEGVDATEVLNDVEAKGDLVAEGMNVKHVPERAVREGRTEDRDLVACAPVVDGVLMPYRLTKIVYEGAG